MKRTLTGMAFVAVLSASASPVVSNVRVTQAESRLVTVNYALSGAPAVVTMNVQTNAGDGAWVDIGGANVWSLHKGTWSPAGDVFRRVETDGEHGFTWRPDRSWPNLKLAAGVTRIVVTAWAPEDAPDYMSVEIKTGGAIGYYPSADYVPGGVLSNEVYRTTSLLFRRIHARGIPWTMGNQFETDRRADREDVHAVTLTNDYYLGVFEVTQKQWTSVGAYLRPTITALHDMRPMQFVSYNDIRDMGTAANYWPASPHASSWLGRLRTMIGGTLDFDLPSEAAWEYACRSGSLEGYWGSGTRYGSGYEGRYELNKGDETTAICGSYRPNRWGLYDMHGNVLEWCLDYGRYDISGLNGAVNVEQDPRIGAMRIVRGGGWSFNSSFMRSSFRAWNNPSYQVNEYGFRVACRAGLK